MAVFIVLEIKIEMITTYSHNILFITSQLLLYQKVFGFSSDSLSGPRYMVFYFPISQSVRNLESQNQGPLFAHGIQSNPEATESIKTIGLVVGEAEGLEDCLLEILHCQDLLTRVYNTKIVYSPEN